MPDSSSDTSPLQHLPCIPNLPRHVAIIMDGNNRWAARHHLQGVAGHKAGAEAAQAVIEVASHYQLEALTLFAFSSENWKRPKSEVQALMDLFAHALKRETGRASQHNMRLRVIGDVTGFSQELQHHIAKAEAMTRDNTGLQVNVAANYGGRWDIAQAAKQLAMQVQQQQIQIDDIQEDTLNRFICLADLPAVDLCIRTSGEQRLSNFLLWQMAYAELVFVNDFWPDFKHQAFAEALLTFSQRQRRFGQSSQLVSQQQAVGQ